MMTLLGYQIPETLRQDQKSVVVYRVIRQPGIWNILISKTLLISNMNMS